MGALEAIVARDPRAARKAAAVLKQKGKGSDTELAHVNPRELVNLRVMSGRSPDGSDDDVNPATGLPMFDEGDDDGNTGNTSNAGENTGGMSGAPGSGTSGPQGDDSAGPGNTDSSNGYDRDVGYSWGADPKGFSVSDEPAADASQASRAGSSMADDYAGMGPERANEYGVGWNEYSEQTTGLQGLVNDILGVTVKGPNVNTPHASWSYDVNPAAMVGGMLIGGPLGTLAGKGLQALGMPGNVSVASGQYTSQIGGNLTSGITDAVGGIEGGTGTVSGPDTSNDGGNDTIQSNVTSNRATQEPGKEAEDTPPLASTNPERNTNRSIDAGKYIDALRQQWGFPKMADRTGSLSNIVAGQGQFGDSALAHLGPGARSALSRAGGVGTRNPVTGARQYYAQADVERAYREVLGRAPDAGGLAAWTADNPNGTYADLANAFRGSDEAQNNAIQNTYQQQLGRAAESPDVVQHYNTAMDTWGREGKDPYAELTRSFQGSDEYKARAAAPAVTPAAATPEVPKATTPATGTNDYADFFAQFTRAMKDAGIGTAAPAATPAAAAPAAASPLQNVSSLTPVRVPRFRSRRYQGYIAPNFAS